ncbi:alpha/beta hydrolase, partial [Tsukamurella soli]|uniref:alpha/beta hydrolase n=1 Tax=Tsukamurella soli TaxID=644556 RepID=UPI0031EB5BB0
ADAPPAFVTALGGPIAAPSSTPAPAAPAWRAPADGSVAWTDCGDDLARQYGMPAPTGTVTVECATMRVAVDPAAADSDEMTLTLTRASADDTPKGAAPLVLVGGTDLTSQRALLTLTAADAPLLRGHPVVAVERRGLGPSSTVSCLPPTDVAVLRNAGAAPGASTAARIAALGSASTDLTNACADKLTGDQSMYTAAAAAADLEVLRTTWSVPALALLSVGDGSTVALAYLAAHPERVARLVLDSPVRYDGTFTDRTEDAAKGTAATMASFATQCRALGCALGDDPAKAVGDVFAKAAAGTLGGVGDAELLRAVTTELAISAGPTSDRITTLADALASARTGTFGPLQALVASADATVGSDGQYITTCSDAGQKPAPDQVAADAAAWAEKYPFGGGVAALNMVGCQGWPAVEPPPAPKRALVPTMAMLALNDPLTNPSAIDGLGGAIAMAGTQLATVSWAGIGEGAVLRSACAQQSLSPYLEDLAQPTTSACPA